MKILITLFFFVVALTCSSQKTNSVDSLLRLACTALENSKELTDSAKIMAVNYEYIFPFIDEQDEKKRDSISDYIYLRFQKLCRSFYQLLERTSKLNEWRKVDHKINSTLNKDECQSFVKQKEFYYIEENGDTTHLTIDGKFWIDRFKDGTYSKLKFSWKTDCEFGLEFIESNNSRRNAVVDKNEKLTYEVVGKYPNRYVIEYSERNEYWIASIYF